MTQEHRAGTLEGSRTPSSRDIEFRTQMEEVPRCPAALCAGERSFTVRYVGWAPLDRRTTLPMLPWLLAEVRRRGERAEWGAESAGGTQARAVRLQVRLSPPLVRCVPVECPDASVFVFEHRAQHISRFVHNSHDLAYFAYLIRSQPDCAGSEMACHVFKASEADQVPDIISSIRQVSKAALKKESKPKQENDDAFYNSQKFEVLYCGKATVASKKGPSSLIDDCMEQFQQHQVDQRRLRGQDGHRAPVFLLGDGEGGFPECILEDCGCEEEQQQEFRTRSNSMRKQRENKGTARRRHASAPGHVQPSDAGKNRTMLFQVGRFEVNLISPDSKTVVLEKNFKEISSCSQGIIRTDHFGFICRDSGETGQSQYVCHVFQCANESLVDEVMLTLKQAFSTATALQSDKTQVKLCEACPMHNLHKLCERIEGLYPPRAKLAIQKHLSQLSDNEQADIFERVQKLKPSTDQEENELVILHLRQLCEAKQKTHLHIDEAPQAPPNNTASDTSVTAGRFTLDLFKNKARSSLTSSLENIFSRGASRMRGRLGSFGSFERQDDCTGESPPGSPPCFPEDEGGAAPLFRRRAHTFSHPPVKKRISFTDSQGAGTTLHRQQSLAPELLQGSPVAGLRIRRVSESDSSPSFPSSSFSAPNFLKSFYQGSLADISGPKSNGESRQRTLSGCSTDSLNFGATPCSKGQISWRQKIFLQVSSPISKPHMQHCSDGLEGRELLPLSPRSSIPDQKVLRSPADYRSLWRKAIHQQILLLRMEKENQRLEASQDELHVRKMKLDYEEVGQCSTEVQTGWEKKLTSLGRAAVHWDKEEIHNTLCQGVPKSRRGEVWLLLAQQHRLRHRLPCKQQPPDASYQTLLKQLTAQQHAILVDLGRTFPTHPYFSTQLGPGQLSLYNLLKAYSLLDTEVGYCQGISFVAGVLLLHMSEEQAFDMLKFLMYDVGFRRQYQPDMISLQIQMYQLSRLLHDYHHKLYAHLEEHEVSPSLYAAPWFLTVFASQFPLGFVARIFDFLFIQGTEVIFKIALCLLRSHESEIMECDGLESIVGYLKTVIPTLTQAQMEETIVQVLEMDISKQLQAYEVEYHVLQDEVLDYSSLQDNSDQLDKLEKTNAQLKKQNMDLLEKLQAARAKIQSLESNMESFMSRESKMKHVIRTLEQEKVSYQKTMERMRAALPTDVLGDVELSFMGSGGNPYP